MLIVWYSSRLVLLEPPGVDHHDVPPVAEHRLQVLRRHVRCARRDRHQLPERLARGVDVGEQLSAIRRPSGQAAGQQRHVPVAEAAEPAHRRGSVGAAVPPSVPVDHQRHRAPGQPVEDLSLQAAQRERGREQGMPRGEASLRAHVEEPDLGPVP
jgi:hypothetical protein